MLKSAIASSRVAAYPVIRDTIAKMNMVALGRVVLTRREHVIALEPRGLGLLGLTLRYPYEVRDEKTYFEDIPALKLPNVDSKTRLVTYLRRNKLGKRSCPFGEGPRHAW